MTLVGIDDIAVHIPRLYLDIKEFARLREHDYGRLNRGLGLAGMAIPDVHEDPATMGANAVVRLIERNNLSPHQIGRLYMGTESALDGSKPTATYIVEMLQQRYADTWGPDCFQHCDVVDMTFACVGAVDALHNTLDWVARGGPEADRIGVVVFADNAKYERGSSGEYTQGAGGGAMLIRHRPRLLAIPDMWGTATVPAHDFFKPRRTLDLQQVFDDVLALAQEVGATLPEGLTAQMLDSLDGSPLRDTGLFAHGHRALTLHKDTPIFDGPLSNRIYREAVKQAFIDFRDQAIAAGRYHPEHDPVLTEQWRRIVLHLPYAYQGRRMFPDIFRYDRQNLPIWDEVVAQIGPEPQPSDFNSETAKGLAAWHKASDQYRRAISKTEWFKTFAAERIERGQRASSLIGNQYTGSLFLALMSSLEADHGEDNALEGATIGLCGYGSGAKAKVFEGIVQPTWRSIVERFELFPRLAQRQPLGAELYEALHRGEQIESVMAPQAEFALVQVEHEQGTREGARTYRWIP